jgi:hypothetical protein
MKEGAMLDYLHHKKRLQLIFGLLMGIIFGFFLQKGGVTRYNVILGQLLLKDWTVVKIMLSAIITGTLGVHWLRSIGYAKLHPKSGGIGSTVIGGLIFGIGFATLGYCPGIVAGAIGQGSLDALTGGFLGILLGSGMFAIFYPKLDQALLNKGKFRHQTFPELFNVDPWVVVIPVVMILVFILWLLEYVGL